MTVPVRGKSRLDFIKGDVPLKDFTTWNVGGPARFFCQPDSKSQLIRALAFSRDKELNLKVIGNGSNLLVRDQGFDGMVVRLGPNFGTVTRLGRRLSVAAGTPLYRLAAAASEAGSSCFNFLTGIPGTVGGGIVMNAGAFGWTISDYLREITYIDSGGNLHKESVTTDCFNYRSSPFQKSERVIVEACFELDFQVTQPDMGKILKDRREKFPYDKPSAGSVFRNPTTVEATAGQLLDKAGAKGLTVGDAVVSHKHANFILNKGHATAKNIQKSIDILREKVYKEFGVTLVTEVMVI